MNGTGKMILAGCTALAAGGILWQVMARQPEPASGEGSSRIRVDVVHQDGSTTSREYVTDDPVLGDLLVKEGLISGEEGSMGLFVTEVDGETVDYEKNGSWWKLSIDGEDAPSGVDSTPVEDGTIYTWTYTVD